MNGYAILSNLTYREAALHNLEEKSTIIVASVDSGELRRARVRPNIGWTKFEVLDESSLEVIATRATAKGAFELAERWTRGEKVRP